MLSFSREELRDVRLQYLPWDDSHRRSAKVQNIVIVASCMPPAMKIHIKPYTSSTKSAPSALHCSALYFSHRMNICLICLSCLLNSPRRRGQGKEVTWTDEGSQMWTHCGRCGVLNAFSGVMNRWREIRAAGRWCSCSHRNDGNA